MTDEYLKLILEELRKSNEIQGEINVSLDTIKHTTLEVNKRLLSTSLDGTTNELLDAIKHSTFKAGMTLDAMNAKMKN